MNLPLAFRSPAQRTTLPVPVPAAPPPAMQTSAPVSAGVYCRHGIHDGYFPLAGISVGDARRMLGPLLHLDPKAVAVINGTIVPDDHTIDSDVAAINFMKESMVKG